ncbi:hypothetical protein FRB99_003800 [Tulasnella sp. 403]|nr:hypothetical protein FRB99_003800 [Tulasnella sp. 403]
MVARSVGRETVQRWLKTGGKAPADHPTDTSSILDKPWIRETTKVNYQQLMKYATEERKVEFENKAIDWANHLLAEAQATGGLRRPAPLDPKKPATGVNAKHEGRRHHAGERLAGMSDGASSLSIASGVIGKGRSTKRMPRSVTDVGVLGKDERHNLATRPRHATWRSPFWEGGWKELAKDAPA